MLVKVEWVDSNEELDKLINSMNLHTVNGKRN